MVETILKVMQSEALIERERKRDGRTELQCYQE